MNRTPLAPHALTRTPHNQVFAALSLAVFVAVGLTLGAGAVGVVIVLWLAGLLGYGYRHGKRQLDAVERDRARAAATHAGLLAERERFAQREGMEYEAASARLAEGFGRIEQEIPDDLEASERRSGSGQGVSFKETAREAARLPLAGEIARHAAGLVAQGVVRTRVEGFPVTVFDLEVLDHFDLEELRGKRKPAQAVELSKDYLTVWSVGLPLALPYVSSAYAWHDAHGEAGLLGELAGPELRAEDADFAAFLMSVPAVRSAALAAEARPWCVDGARLLTSVRTNSGTVPEAVRAVAAELAAVAAAFPWRELERFRVEEAGDDERSRAARVLWTHRWDGAPGAPVVGRWEDTRITRGGLRAFLPAILGSTWATPAPDA
ncbi:hypothetical protein ACWGJ2_23190 [Streptomyces sp. NPDC054796]